jgi:hypothetical protein
MEITQPLFPNGDDNPELFYEWKQFLKNSLILSNPQTNPQTHNFQPMENPSTVNH